MDSLIEHHVLAIPHVNQYEIRTDPCSATVKCMKSTVLKLGLSFE